MKLSHGNTARALAVALTILVGACGSNRDVKMARNSVYDTEFANVYSAVVSAVRTAYPTFDENPDTGVVKTAWHQVKYSNPGADDPKSAQVADRAAGAGAGAPTASAMGYNPSLAKRLYFIRFDVTVVGVRPWRVRVVGTASELRPGDALPTDLKGEAVPHWLAGRTDALTVAIYRRLKAYAIPMEIEAPPEPEAIEEVTIAGDLPAAAQAVAADIVRALHKRDYAALRRQVADDVVWSRGAAPGADVALAMWQADTTVLTALEQAITGGCGGDATEVACPAASAPATLRARFGLRAGQWKLVAFAAE
jgi:hypothetical protein